MTARLYLDDLSVGDTFRSGEYVVEPAAIVAFAEEFDPQPFHLDPVAAEASLFRGLAASGWHTAAITMRLLVESVPFATGLVGAGVEVSWPSPVRPGEALHVETTIAAITPSRSKPDQAFVTLESRTLTNTGELRQAMTSKVLAFRRRD